MRSKLKLTRFSIDADIHVQIRQLLPVARKILAEGMDPTRCAFTEDMPVKEPDGLTDEQTGQLITWSNVHYLVGVAVGLLLNPTLFVENDRR